MRNDKRLDVASLAVESFVISPLPAPKHPAPHERTCLLTNCGPVLCCL
ncbi:MAG: hypothetical protein JO306_10850 [Gemmatimonadetes bacterium]|nr:hypothetical protein [Gemmatimonadota bacterium]